MSTRLSTEELEQAAFAIAHIAGCDEPNSNARLCNIAEQIAFGNDGCECLNMALAAFAAIPDDSAARRALRDLTARMDFHGIHQEWNELVAARAILSENPEGTTQ